MLSVEDRARLSLLKGRVYAYDTMLYSSVTELIIKDMPSFRKAKRSIETLTEEIYQNLGLDEAEFKEYLVCISILENKILLFIKANPEYGI